MAKPEPQQGEALVKVLVAGICNTDLEIACGYMGFKGVLGHEFVGIVETVIGPDRGLTGKRVVGDINCGCGICNFCHQGLNRHCQSRVTLGIDRKNGCLAEYVVMPLTNLYEVPASVSDEEAVFCEPLAAVFEILEQVHLKPTDRVAVLGDGKLGLLTALTLRQFCPSLSLIGRHPEKLAIAEAQQINTMLSDELLQTTSFDLVVEATGRTEGFDLACKLLKPRGTMVLKSTVASGGELNLSAVVIDEITVVGSRCGPFEPALQALEKKQLDPRPLITKIYCADDMLRAFEAAGVKGNLKILVDFR